MFLEPQTMVFFKVKKIDMFIIIYWIKTIINVPMYQFTINMKISLLFSERIPVKWPHENPNIILKFYKIHFNNFYNIKSSTDFIEIQTSH